MSTKRKAIFEPHIKSFFVRTSDPTHIKLLKLEILTNLASAASISLILREFQTYISSSDRPFVAATIQAIGRCAGTIKEVTETCLSGLVHLLSNRDEHVVAESVVVIKKLLQTKAAQHYDIISQMAKLLDFIKVPAARSAIIWLIGEYSEKVPKIAPDVLRKMAKTFVDEEDAVKLQVLNLSVKLYLTNPQQTSLLCQYVFTLARYDVNYDIRDRARFLKQFIFPSNGKSNVLSEVAKKVFLSAKPAPTLESKYHTRNLYQLGSLSHYLNMRCSGYNDLPSFPQQPSDASVRNVEGFMQENPSRMSNHMSNNQPQHTPQKENNSKQKKSKKPENSFFSESEDKSSEYSSSSESSSGSSTSSESDSDDENKNETTTKTVVAKEVHNNNKKIVDLKANNNNNIVNNANGSGTSDSESSSSYGSSSSSASESSETESDSESEEETPAKNNNKNANSIKTEKENQKEQKSNLDLLLDLDDIPPIGPVMTPSLGGFLTPGTPLAASHTAALIPQPMANRIDLVGPSYIAYNYKELLNKLSGHGLQVSYRYTRSPHLYSSAMVSIELQFVNQGTDEISNIQMGQKSLPPGMQMQEFAPINILNPGQCATSVMGVDFNDSTHAIDFEICSNSGTSRVTFKPIIGELVRSVHITETLFKEERLKLRGMNEHQTKLKLKQDTVEATTLKQKIFECINVAAINGNNDNPTYNFVGQTMTSKSLVLITCDWSQSSDELVVQVNCEKMVIGSMVLNEITSYLNATFKY
ncbi:AP-3 complex subunit beta-2 [Lucilia cuprina]|nr:AP-3 complex subunit beta-2 [Lucilia cuprina]